MNREQFEEAIRPRLPTALNALRRTFPHTQVDLMIIANGAWRAATQQEPHELSFAWLYRVAWTEHLALLAGAARDKVRDGIRPRCERLGFDADEVVQDAWLKARLHFDQRDELATLPDTSEQMTRWFYRVADRLLTDRTRSRGRTQVTPLTSDPPQVNESHEQERKLDRIEQLRQGIEKLPESERCVIRLLMQGKKPARIAEKLQTPPATVYSLIRRAKILLGRFFASQTTEEDLS